MAHSGRSRESELTYKARIWSGTASRGRGSGEDRRAERLLGASWPQDVHTAMMYFARQTGGLGPKLRAPT